LINFIAYVDTKIKGILHYSKICRNPFKNSWDFNLLLLKIQLCGFLFLCISPWEQLCCYITLYIVQNFKVEKIIVYLNEISLIYNYIDYYISSVFFKAKKKL